MPDEIPQPPGDLQAKCDEAMVGWKRALADYDNLKKDLNKERADIRRYAQQDAAERFLAVLDNFDQATKHVPEGLDAKLKGWVNGILFIRTQMENALKEMGLEPFGTVGETFDPNLHEAAKGEGDKIAEVVRRGWKMGERIVRSASVVVSK